MINHSGADHYKAARAEGGTAFELKSRNYLNGKTLNPIRSSRSAPSDAVFVVQANVSRGSV